MSIDRPEPRPPARGPADHLIRFCLENRLVVLIGVLGLVAWGISVAPFDWNTGALPRDPVAVDAIPDIGENQQIVFTEWKGRSPQDVEDQITYPLTTQLLGLPQVRTVRSFSMFGFSSIYIIFEEDTGFYWSRSRILEKLNSLSPESLPAGVTPRLGPDATALGQVFWYTLEGRDPEGKPTGGWDLDELRSVQDWFVRYALQGVQGVAEVASAGGFVREYQVDVDPDALRSYGIPLEAVFNAVRQSNRDAGARTLEINRAEYVIRGLGQIESLNDLRSTVVLERERTPITLGQVATVHLGPGERRGALDKGGAEVAGGVVVTRYGENPLAVIQAVKEKIAEISPGLPAKTLADGTRSQLAIVPFYDRTGLIQETLGTLEDAVRQQILVTIVVIILMLFHLRAASLVAGMLPLAVLFTFIGMKLFGVDANIVALSGIAIAIGTIVDMGIVLTENILRHLRSAPPGKDRLEVVFEACKEVSGAVVTAVMTTVISFLPVFTMVGAEGKLFRPLAYTKTFALVASILIALTVIPPAAHWLLRHGRSTRQARNVGWAVLVALAWIALVAWPPFPLWLALAITAAALWNILRARLSAGVGRPLERGVNLLLAAAAALVLAADWQPFGPENEGVNAALVLVGIAFLIIVIYLFIRFFDSMLAYLLRMKGPFLGFCALILLSGLTIWLGWPTVMGWTPQWARGIPLWQGLAHAFPGLQEEFMPELDEGSFLYMPTTMPHASIGEVRDVLRIQNMAISAIPEVETVVGKLGRADSPLDPAPLSMIETVIQYTSEYRTDDRGNILTFAYDTETGEFVRDPSGELLRDPGGRPFRQWRDSIQSTADIWDAIVDAAAVPGTTSAPRLQPIAARLVMLQSGVRAPMAFKVQGPDLETIEAVALEVEAMLKEVPSVQPSTVFADRVVGKPYLEIDIDREAIARYALTVSQVQDVIEVAIGGMTVTQVIEGRERYPVRVRYQRERRGSIEDLESILVAGRGGVQIPLRELAEVRYRRGPQMIKSEDTFLVAYVIFDRQPGVSEVEAVEDARSYLRAQLDSGQWELPAGVKFPEAIGSYQNQVRAEKTLRVVLPLALLIIFLILYLQFREVSTTLLVFSGIAFAWAGGFILIWLYGQPWFLDLSLFGENLRALFQMGEIHLSIAVWVGFLALFGIATDNGVIVCTYLQQRFRERDPKDVQAIREATIQAAVQRIRPAMMTTATTLFALLPVLTSTGRGAEIMVPMAIPTFGGMLLAVLTVLIVPVLYCLLAEMRLKRRLHEGRTRRDAMHASE